MQTSSSMRRDHRHARLSVWRRALWLTLLVASSVALTLGFACAVPFAAFAAAAALTLDRRSALFLVTAVWLANQVVGYAVLDYPWTWNSVAWGVVLGVVSVLATMAAQTIVEHLRRRVPIVRWAAVFLGAFVIFEAGLFLVAAALLGGSEDFAPSVVAYVFAINAAGFAGLLILSRLGMSIGLSPASIRPPVVAQRA